MRPPAPPVLALFLLATLPSAQTPLHSAEVASGLARPVAVAAPRGDERVFVAEQHTGLVRIAKGGAVLPTPFLDLSGEVAQGSEQGLLALAFHPDYALNGELFVLYSNLAGTSVVERYRVSPDPDVADPASAEAVLELPQPEAHHNGGSLAFGPHDGMLYLSFGDGGGNGDPDCRAQDLGGLYGKVLRIDVDGGTPYAVPPSNPFVGVPGAAGEIWALGLRNPWRMGFDPATGDLYVGDVGQILREEIDFLPAGVGGLNFGWKTMEATLCFDTDGCGNVPPCGDPAYTDPIHHMSHTGFFGPCAVVGGAVYRGCAIPDLQGTYFFSDYCLGHVWSFRYENGEVRSYQVRTPELTPPGTTIDKVTTFGEDGFGELLFAMHGTGSDGAVYRIEPSAPPAALVDCDGNGLDDPCEVGSFAHADLDGDGGLDACQELSADVAALSVAAGGEQNLALHGGAAVANLSYVVLGSVSGSEPGFDVGGFHVPLVPDFYTTLTLTSPGDPPLTDSVGDLDGSGAAQALFTVPPALFAPLVGIEVRHAWVAVDGALAVQLASNPVLVALVP